MRLAASRIDDLAACVAATLAILAAIAAFGFGQARAAEASGLPDFARQGRPFLEQYCFDCHSGAEAEVGVALDGYRDAASVANSRKQWEAVLRMVQTGQMPPADSQQPPADEREAFSRLVQAVFAGVDRDARPDPGRVTMRRLNRIEYRNTVRDLAGVDFDPAEDFPSDDVGHGFDNIGDVLTLSPVLMERYLSAAESIVQRPACQQRLLACSADKSQPEQTREILGRFASQAYRRPATEVEVDRLVALVEASQAEGEKWEAAVHLALQAVLVSPKFLFRVELDNDPHSSQIRPLDEYQLASRLSYFLWSTMPDPQLFELAEKKRLTTDLEGQVRRMLQDDKAGQFVENFALQWLQLRRLETAAPDPKLFPSFDERLRWAMLEETKRFFEAVMREDRSVLELIDADFTFVNGQLAKHYGIAGKNGAPKRRGRRAGDDPFVRVAVQGEGRGGLLTQASVLTVTSNPTRTSPVKRGRWVLEQILGTPPPPPPPDVPLLPEGEQDVLSGTLRQRMEQHRANPACANCHASMDPIGFAFENYDAIGRFRTQDGQFPIDPAGELPDGSTFQGAEDLKAVLRNKKQQFARALTENMLTYALGRGLGSGDRPAVNRIVAALDKNDYRFSTLVVEIARSEPFRLRRGG